MKNFKYLFFLFFAFACTEVPPPKKGSTIVIKKIELSGGESQNFIVHYEEIPSGRESHFITDAISYNIHDTVFVK